MASTGLSQRRRTAYAARQAARQRRQKVMIGVLLGVLALLMIFELPKVLHSLNKHADNSTAPVVTTAAGPHRPLSVPRAFKSSTDPFSARSLTGSDPNYGPETGGRDPFAQPGTGVAATPPPVVKPATVPLPQQIVVGTPGHGRHAHRGWIVILASIPTGEGRSAAVRFATHASVTGLSILNSSNRRPLRGGYWVVYDGPYNTLGQVTSRSAVVHAAGYPTAYIRELIVYR